LIPDVENFLAVAIFKMATTIPVDKFMVRGKKGEREERERE
jgi:hypothetical protein